MTSSCPGRSLRRSRSSFGMTTWNFGDTLTVCIELSYGNHIDIAFVCQYVYRLLYRTTGAQPRTWEFGTSDGGEGLERKPVRALRPRGSCQGKKQSRRRSRIGRDASGGQ